MNGRIAVLGGGGHAKVVISTLRSMGLRELVVFDDIRKPGSEVLGAPVLGPIAEAWGGGERRAIIAIGSNDVRLRIADELPDMEWVTVIHPSAVVDETARIGAGTVVFAGAILQPEVVLGRHVIINTMASVDHDGQVADYAQLCPGVRLAGAVSLGQSCFLGTGAIIAPGVRVGNRATIGAGAVVLRDVPAEARAYGVPASLRP